MGFARPNGPDRYRDRKPVSLSVALLVRPGRLGPWGAVGQDGWRESAFAKVGGS